MNDVLLVAVFDEVYSGVLIVVLNCLEERFERDVVIDERVLIDNDVILFHVSTEAEHVCDAAHRPQLQLGDPVLNRPQLLSAFAGADDFVKLNLSCVGGDRSHLGIESCGNAVLCQREPLENLLTREVDVDLITKINGRH